MSLQVDTYPPEFFRGSENPAREFFGTERVVHSPALCKANCLSLAAVPNFSPWRRRSLQAQMVARPARCLLLWADWKVSSAHPYQVNKALEARSTQSHRNVSPRVDRQFEKSTELPALFTLCLCCKRVTIVKHTPRLCVSRYRHTPDKLPPL